MVIFTLRNKGLGFQVDNDVVMMMAKIHGSTAKSAAGQQRLQGNGFEFPADVFGQTAESILIDERHCSDQRLSTPIQSWKINVKC